MTHQSRNYARWLFPSAFAFSCLLFWWLPSILLAFLHADNPITSKTIRDTILAFVFFFCGYLIPLKAPRKLFISIKSMEQCSDLAYKLTLLIAVPAFVVSLLFAIARARVTYSTGGDMPFMYQAVLYTHLFVGYMFLGSVPDMDGPNRKRVILAAFLLIFPRLVISLQWQRFFVGQTCAAILLIVMARGWVRISGVRILQLILLAAAIIFVPAYTRGDPIFGTDPSGNPRLLRFFQSGSTLIFYQDYQHLQSECPPLLVSMTAKIIPYSLLHVCTMTVGNAQNTPAVLSSLITRQDSNDLALGTGSIYILELYLTGGIAAVLLGSALFGLSCRLFVEHLGARSLVAGIWAECLVRSLYAPRGNLGYVYERIPSLLAATAVVMLLCWAGDVLRAKPIDTTSC